MAAALTPFPEQNKNFMPGAASGFGEGSTQSSFPARKSGQGGRRLTSLSSPGLDPETQGSQPLLPSPLTKPSVQLRDLCHAYE